MLWTNLETFRTELRFPRFRVRYAGACCPVWNTREKISAPSLRRDLPLKIWLTYKCPSITFTRKTLINFLSHLTFPYFDGLGGDYMANFSPARAEIRHVITPLVAWSDLNLAGFPCRRRDMMICYHWKRSKLPLTTLSLWRQNLVTKLPSCLTQLIIVVFLIKVKIL